MKDLLGIANDTPISLRFADPPFAAVSDVYAILKEPHHVVSLIVSPLQCGGSASVAPLAGLHSAGCRYENGDLSDPLCKRRRQHSLMASRSAPGARRGSDETDSDAMHARRKCSPAEMNRLLEALTEVDDRLQRTQEQCDAIEARCARNKKAAQTRQRQHRHSRLGRSGVMTFEVVEAETTEEEDEKEHGRDVGSGKEEAMAAATCNVLNGKYLCQGEVTCARNPSSFAEDGNVERLIQIANSLTQSIIQQQKSTFSHSGELTACLSGFSGVCVCRHKGSVAVLQFNFVCSTYGQWLCRLGPCGF